MKTIEEMIEVMQAYADGKKIQVIKLDIDDDTWSDINSPCWDWINYDFRIKPEKKTRRMTYSEVLSYWNYHRDELFIYKENDAIITGRIEYTNDLTQEIHAFGKDFTIYDWYDNVTKEDGSKFEIER